MKFLCDQCKAKYQIADEKVSGKTLRMKCRKCGHIIEIRAATEATASGETVQVSSLSDDAAASLLARPSQPPPPAANPVAARPSAPKPTSPPRAVAINAAQKTAAPRPITGFNAPRTAPGKDLTPKQPAASPLASAFNKQVSISTATNVESSQSASEGGPDVPTEEWYVAIDDVPVGPIRLSELRSKYAQGTARDESLVWREGYEEWRPLRSLPDLYRVVKEEVSGAQAQPRGSSLLPNSQRSSPPRTTAPSAPARPSARPVSTPAPRAGGNVIPFVQPRGGAAARKIEEDDDEATQIGPSPFAMPRPEPAPISGQSAKVVDDPFAAPLAGSAASAPRAGSAATPMAPPAAHADDVGRATVFDKLEARGISKGIVALIAAAALLFGVVIAVFAIKPTVVEKVVEKRVDVPVSVLVPVPGQPAPTASTAAPEPTSTTTAKVAWKPGTPSAPTTTAPTSTATSKKLGNDMGPDGPAVPTAGGGATGTGGSLDGKSVEGVVASKRVGVRKVCYEPWADKGGASVKVTLKIGPDGRVQSSDIATSSGEPAIGQCVQRMAKGWAFPPSDAGGTFNIPFLFGT